MDASGSATHRARLHEREGQVLMAAKKKAKQAAASGKPLKVKKKKTSRGK